MIFPSAAVALTGDPRLDAATSYPVTSRIFARPAEDAQGNAALVQRLSKTLARDVSRLFYSYVIKEPGDAFKD